MGDTISGRDIHAFDNPGDRKRSLFIDDAEQLAGLDKELIRFGYDIVDEAHRMSFGGFDHPAGEHNFDCAAPADQLCEPLGPPIAGNETEVDLRLAKFGVGDTKTEMAGHRELTSAAKRKTVDG